MFRALLVIIVHCAHTALGMPALEGIEQIILSAGPSTQFPRLRRMT